MMDASDFAAIVARLPGNRRLEQRTTLYGRVPTPA
jgi:hypothetical protein